MKFTRQYLNVTCIGFLAAGILLSHRFKVEDFRDSKVSSGRLLSAFNLVFVHISQQRYLTVNGSTYSHIGGIKPYYIHLKPLDSILFAEEPEHGPSRVYIFNIKSGTINCFTTIKSSFGGNINTLGEFTDYVESTSDNKVILVSKRGKRVWHIVLNLISHRVDSESFSEE